MTSSWLVRIGMGNGRFTPRRTSTDVLYRISTVQLSITLDDQVVSGPNGSSSSPKPVPLKSELQWTGKDRSTWA
jgi:hypothetical protein